LFIAVSIFGIAAVQAMPAAPLDQARPAPCPSPAVCGPGWHRDFNGCMPSQSRHAPSSWHRDPWSWVRERAEVSGAIVFATATDAGGFATGEMEAIFRQMILTPLRRGLFLAYQSTRITLIVVNEKRWPA
jgi:hypothetical protein